MGKNCYLKMKALRTPGLLLWTRGIIHGKLLHTGELDQQTERISSGFITGQLARFQSACAVCCEETEAALGPLWTEADRILLELRTLSAELKQQSGLPADPGQDSPSQARSRERQTEARATCTARQLQLRQRLAGLSNTIAGKLRLAEMREQATAAQLRSTFSAYGHGLLLRPVAERNLPPVPGMDIDKQILQQHLATWNAIQTELEG